MAQLEAFKHKDLRNAREGKGEIKRFNRNIKEKEEVGDTPNE